MRLTPPTESIDWAVYPGQNESLFTPVYVPAGRRDIVVYSAEPARWRPGELVPEFVPAAKLTVLRPTPFGWSRGPWYRVFWANDDVRPKHALAPLSLASRLIEFIYARCAAEPLCAICRDQLVRLENVRGLHCVSCSNAVRSAITRWWSSQ